MTTPVTLLPPLVYYSVELCREHPNKLFVFGDNTKRWGNGGQAIIRGEPNAFGIATKVSIYEYFSDDYLEQNKQVIWDDFKALIEKSKDFKEGLVISSNFIGTGLSDMPFECPKTWEFLKFMWNNAVIGKGVNLA